MLLNLPATQRMPEALPLILLDAALRGALLCLLLLLGTVMLRDRPRLPAARAAAAMCLGLCIQAFSSTPLVEATLPVLVQAPMVAVSVGNAVLFWIFVQALFDDDFVLHPVHLAAWSGVALLSAINCVLGPHHAWGSVTFGLQRGVPMVFAVLAVVAATAHWRADLVEGRRRLRAFILVAGVAYTLTMLIARLASPQGRLSGGVATLDVGWLLLIVGVIAWRRLGLVGSDLFPSQALPAPGPASGRAAGPGVTDENGAGALSAPEATPSAASPASAVVTESQAPGDSESPGAAAEAEQRLANSLQRVMSEAHAYRTEDLSVASLAARLAVPEYRLRRVINQRLGHRNFNAYVNGLRLAEARAALADPQMRERPVLTIALDVGFGSIGPFNRAFKAATGLTPTEFRKERLADS